MNNRIKIKMFCSNENNLLNLFYNRKHVNQNKSFWGNTHKGS